MNPAEFENIAQNEDRLWWYAGMRKILEAWIRRMGGTHFERVLEAGCGTGYTSTWLSRRYGWRMYPADIAIEGLAYASDSGLARLTQADISALPFAEGSFDAAVCLDVLAHFATGDEAAALGEIYRVLKPGAKFLLRTAALDSLRSKHSEIVEERQRFTAARLRGALEGAGFRVLDLSYANSLLLPVAWFKFRVWEPLTGQEPASGVQMPAPLMNSILGIPLELEAAWMRMGGRLPLGQSLLVLAEK